MGERMSETMTEAEVLAYLNTLRKNGVTNMLSCAPYLVRDMGLLPDEASGYALRYISSKVRGEFAPPENRTAYQFSPLAERPDRE